LKNRIKRSRARIDRTQRMRRIKYGGIRNEERERGKENDEE
jgi:hypothetical protein